MDTQDFQDLYDAEGLYADLQDNLASFYENFEALGKDLTARERARRNQIYEEQMEQLEEQLNMLEEIYEVSGDSIGGLGEDFSDVLQGIRSDLRKYKVAYKRAYSDIGKERDKFFDGMEDAFAEITERITSIFTAFKVDQIADTLTDSAESYTKNLRDIQNIRGYNDEQLDGLREELGQYVQQIHDSGGKLSINEYSENVQQWVEHGFRDDMASSMGMQQDLMEKTLGVDISQIEDLVDQMWYSGYDVVGLVEKSTKYLKALKKSSEFQEADIGSILDTLNDGANWVGMEAKNEADYEAMMKGLEQAYVIADANGLDSKTIDDIFSGLYDRTNMDVRQQLAGIGVDYRKMYQQLQDRDYTGALQTLVESSSEKVMSMDNTRASQISQALGTDEELIQQLKALQMSGGIDWNATKTELENIGDGVDSLEGELESYHVSVTDRLKNWLSSSELGQTISSVITDLGIDVTDVALLTTSIAQLAELRKLNGKNGVGGLFSKLFGKKGASGTAGAGRAGARAASAGGVGTRAASAGTGLLSKILGSAGTVTEGTLAGGTGILGGLSSAGATIGSGASTAGGLAAAGGAGIAGGLLGGISLIESVEDLATANNESNWKEREDKKAEGGLGIASVGAGAGVGAAIGSVVPGLGTAIGALIGAGVGGTASLIWGDDWAESLTDILDGTKDMKKSMESATKAQEEYSSAFDKKKNAEEELIAAQESGESQAIKTAEANLKLAEAEERLAALRNREAAKKVAEEISTAGVQYQKSYSDAENIAQQANDYLEYQDLISQIKAGIDEGKIESYRDENGLLNYRSSDENYQNLLNQVNSDEMKEAGKEAFGFTDGGKFVESSLYSAINDYDKNSDDWIKKGEEATNSLATANEAMTEAMANMEQMSGQVLAYAESIAKLAGYDSLESMANADPSTLGWQEKEALGMVTDTYNAVGDSTGISKEVASAGATANNKTIVDTALKEELDGWYRKISSVYKKEGNNAAQELEKGELSDWLEQELGVPTSITNKYHIDVREPDFIKDYEDGIFDEYLKYKTGISYVPEDEQPALLHKGEAVLTRQEADDWRQTRGIEESVKPSTRLQSNLDEDSVLDNWKKIWIESIEDVKDGITDIWTEIIYDSSKRASKKQERKSWFASLFHLGDDSSSDSSFVDGSHAEGLSYVPYDGYIAELHEGEAVIPKEENPYIEAPSNTKTITIDRSVETYDNSELVKVVRQGFEAVIKKMDKSPEPTTINKPVRKAKKPFQSAALYNL